MGENIAPQDQAYPLVSSLCCLLSTKPFLIQGMFPYAYRSLNLPWLGQMPSSP